MLARGPDGAGLWLAEDRRVGLAHRRLSIIDLSAAGAQPMASADGRYRIVFNGEIYNYRALRDGLAARGYGFRSHSDTEVLLALYAEQGEAMLAQLRGMFAFAIWDAQDRCLFLARDAYGIKPLYYADDGRTLRVASQVQALRAGGAVDTAADVAALAGFYLFGTVPEPLTAMRAVRALPAGSWLRVRDGGVEGPRRWHGLSAAWRAAATVSEHGSTAGDEVASQIAEALRDSVRHHLVADVAVGAFLSSGIDSGALVGLMAESGQAPQTLTVAFEEFRGLPQDESPLAAEVAAHYGCTHQVYRVSESGFREDWPRILAAMDQPSIDGVNTWYASQAARLAGLKVAVSGLGGDELFGGYPAFRDLPRWRRWLGPAARVPGLGVGLRRLAGLRRGAAPGLQLSPKALSLLEYAGSWPGAWLLRRGLFMPWELPALMGEEASRAGLERLQALELIGEALTPDPGTDFGRVAALEAGLYMRNQLLRDSDWAGMTHGIEIRVPLVDTVLLQRVAPLLLAAGDARAVGKQALACAPHRPLPDAVRQRPKTGFTVPFADWLGRVDGLDVWKRVPALARSGCHWSRRLAYALAQDEALWGRGPTS
jgi:asparagine synthase (glutamine-hydrolysing)